MDIKFSCTSCGQNIVMDHAGSGSSIDCPSCSKPVYVPHQTSPVIPEIPSRVDVKTARPLPVATPSPQYTPTTTSRIEVECQQDIHPAIQGSLHCLVIIVGLGIIGLFAYSQDMLVGAGILFMIVPFLWAELLCAVYGICAGEVKKGLMLLGGLSLVIALGGYLYIFTMTKQMSKQSDQMQRMMQQMLH